MCYSDEIYAVFVDGELGVEEARRVQRHLDTCRRCAELVAALRDENRALSEILHELPADAESPSLARGIHVFPSRVSWSRRSWVWGDAATVGAVLALAAFATQWIDQQTVPGALEWLNPFSFTGGTNVIFRLSYYFTHGGAAVFTHYAAVVGSICLLALLGSGLLMFGRKWRLHHTGLVFMMVLLALSPLSFGLERRHSQIVVVPASETIDDTLLVAANTVRVEGVVNGDLIVFTRNLEVSGTVKGDVLSFAQKAEIGGTVEGHIFTFSQSFDLNGQLDHSIYAWVQSFRLGSKSRVGDGIIAGTGDITLDGEVARSVTIFSGSADVSGNIGRDLTMAGGNLSLASTARVGGDLLARVHRRSDVNIAEGATIRGMRDIQVTVRKSRFARPEFYFFQAVWLLAAMLVGWLAMLLFPRFFEGNTQAVGEAWRSLGLGIVLLICVPVVAIVAVVTLVGIPLAMILLTVYVGAIYLSKLWVGAFLGKLILKPATVTTGDWLLALLVGLVIITVVRWVPFIGGLVHLGVVCLGMGALAWQVYRMLRPVATA